MKKTSDRFSINFAATIAAIVLLSNIAGCVGYRVGSMLPDKYRTVAVPTFVNDTSEPLIENPTTSATINEIQMDGSLRIADSDNADTLLKVTITNFEIRPIAFSDDRARRADEYRMHISTSIVLTDRETGEVVVESSIIQGFADFIVSGDLTSSKQAALPEASRDLAQRIVQRIVEVW